MRMYPPKEYFYQAHPRTEGTAAEFGASYRRALSKQRDARIENRVFGKGKFSLGRTMRRGIQGYRRAVPKSVRQALRTEGKTFLASAGPIGAMAGDTIFGEGAYYGAGRSLSGRGSYGAPFMNNSDEIVTGQRFFKPHFEAAGVGDDDGGLLITNQEYVQSVYGNPSGTSFASTTFNVNPGLAEIFPMLSQFANNFERYELIQCVFHFETQIDEGVFQSGTGQVGDILMYSHMDPTEPDLQNVSEFQMNGGSSARVTKGLTCGVECDPEQMTGLPNAGLNFIRTGPKTEIGEYDQGKFQIAVSNTPSGLADQVIGKLYVSYTVKLVKPRIHSLVSRNVLMDQFVGHDNQHTITAGNLIPKSVASNMHPLNTNGIGASVVVDPYESFGGANSAQRVTITLPNWLQGCLLVKLDTQTELAGKPGTSGSGDVDDYHQQPQGQFVYVTTTGEVSGVSMYPSSDSSGLIGMAPETTYLAANGADGAGVPNLGNMGGYNYLASGGDSKCIWFGTFTRAFRISPALVGDNKITLTVNSTTSTGLSAGNVIGALRSSLSLTLVNDYDAVGTQGITNVASLN